MPAPVVAAAAAPVAAPWLTAGASLAGSVATSAFNAWQASKNRDFQERMSNTAHQREVADLRAAGLNPILSARHGGATSPPGSSAQGVDPDLGGKYLAGLQLKGQLAVQEAQVQDLHSAAALKREQTKDITDTRTQRIDLLIGQALDALESSYLKGDTRKKMLEEIQNLLVERQHMKLEVQHSAFGINKSKAESDFYGGAGGKIAPWLGTVDRLQGLKSLGPAAQKVLDMLKKKKKFGF